MARLDAFLGLAVGQGGSDVHLIAGNPPRVRIAGVLHQVKFRELADRDVRELIGEIMPEIHRGRLETEKVVDFAYDAGKLGRFRVNASHQHLGLAAVLRAIPERPLPLEELGLPGSVTRILENPRGLVVVTGPTGSGKSTTVAAMVDHINRTRKGHIITIEDPIEFRHTDKQSVITQREVGVHSPSFTQALRDALREDPDTILIGELRDPETIGLALTAVETGVQVLGTLHTHGAVRAISRMINAFPQSHAAHVRAMLAESLGLVVSQQLVRPASGPGRLMVADVLVQVPAVASMIRGGKTHQLSSLLSTRSADGMQSLDAELQRLVNAGEVGIEEARERAIDGAVWETNSSRTPGQDGG